MLPKMLKLSREGREGGYLWLVDRADYDRYLSGALHSMGIERVAQQWILAENTKFSLVRVDASGYWDVELLDGRVAVACESDYFSSVSPLELLAEQAE